MQSNDLPTATRVARDELGERTSYEDIVVGQDLGTLEWTVTSDAIAKQCSMDGDEDAMFGPAASASGQIAPPQISYRPPRWLFSRTFNIRGVFYRWEMENTAPIRAGATITVGGRISKKWIKGEREFVEFEATGTDQSGQIVFRTRRVHVLDMVKRTAPRSGVGMDSGKKPEKI